MWIQNCAADDIPKGFHVAVGENSMLIQIMDTATSWWPVPKHKFKEVHQFEFLDVEEKDHVDDEVMKCSQAQADQLVTLLLHAKAKRMDVIIHCYAGICRSGAVADVGIQLGFQDTERFRAPNLLVKHRMMKALGWTYDSEEKQYEVHGSLNEWGNFVPNARQEGDI